MFRSPKYYAELRKQGRQSPSAQAPTRKRPSRKLRVQASSLSLQAPGSVDRGTSEPSPCPGHKQQE